MTIVEIVNEETSKVHRSNGERTKAAAQRKMPTKLLDINITAFLSLLNHKMMLKHSRQMLRARSHLKATRVIRFIR